MFPDDLQRSLAGRYVLEHEIGSGGMATVYLARDVRHDRNVAIKVLKPELAAVLGAERFLSEIRVTANLQHPNLLPLFDSGEAGGLLFYVMPFVEGETLRARLERERQLPVDEAVRIAVALAGALGEAHAHGVVHRDLKPENIMLRAGQPMIADFGIALAVSRAGGARLTETGLSLGTPQYMSPEQATGERAIDGRSDIYSLGTVTYEMLAGEPPFSGPTSQAIIARIMTTEPRSLQSVRPSVPTNVDCAIEKALAKIPADRFASAREFADALTNPGFTTSTAFSSSARAVAGTGKFRGLFFASSAAAVVIGAVAIIGWIRAETSRPVARYALAMEPQDALKQARTIFHDTRLAISPDGSHIVYVGGPQKQLLVKSRDQLQPVPLAGTEDARTPFFSPDGTRVGFTVGTVATLKIVALDGGTPLTVSDSLIGHSGASWSRDGFIYTDASEDTGLLRIAARTGAIPTAFTTLDKASGEEDHQWPDALPNGNGVLFAVSYDAAHKQNPALAVADVKTGRHRVVLKDVTHPRYTPGYVVYFNAAGRLMAVPFDQDRLTVTGDPVELPEDPSATEFALANDGTLAMVTGGREVSRELVWVTRNGNESPLDSSWHATFDGPRFSPDGSKLAFAVFTNTRQDNDIWIRQLDRGTTSKLTPDGGKNYFYTWTRDGNAITFASPRVGDHFDLWTKRVDGTRQNLQLHWKENVYESRWSPDGKWLIFSTSWGPSPSHSILAIRPGVDSQPPVKLSGQTPAISPDGRYLTYISNESGRNEIYVVPFPDTRGGKWQVSSEGGTQPVWAHSGRELFYRDTVGRMISVSVNTTPTFRQGRSAVLFSNPDLVFDEWFAQYDISRDDQRFVMVRPASSGPDKLFVVENWLVDLKRGRGK